MSPPQSSSDEESWPVWQQLWGKKPALEAEREVRQAPQTCRAQPCCLARKAKSHRRAKLRDIADDLITRFDSLEAKWLAEEAPRREDKGAATTPW